MKHLYILLLLLPACITATSAQETFSADGFVFRVTEGDKVRIIDPINYPSNTPAAPLYHYQEVTTLVVPESVEHPVTGKQYTVTGGYLMMNEHVTEIVWPETCEFIGVTDMAALRHLDIPEGVETIGDISDLQISELILPASLKYIDPVMSPTLSMLPVETLVIPEGVKRIENAISSCDNLAMLEIKGAESIGSFSIQFLPALKKLVLSPELENVEGGVALDTDPEEIWFPSDGVERPWKLSVNSFVCHTKRVYCARMTPPTFDGDMTAPEYASVPADRLMFYGPGNIGNVTLYVPAEAVEAYKAARNWVLMNIQPYNFRDNIPLTAADATAPADTPLYDLQGRPAATETPTPGIYLRAGKKVIVR